MSRIEDALTELAACLCAQLEQPDVTPVCFCGIMPGSEVSLEYTGDCEPLCGMAWVRLTSGYPSNAIGIASLQPGNCTNAIGIDVEVGIVRCIEVGGSDGSPPTPAQLELAAKQQWEDMLLMIRAVVCCKSSKDYVVGQYAPYGPEGGVVGGTITMAMLVT